MISRSKEKFPRMCCFQFIRVIWAGTIYFEENVTWLFIDGFKFKNERQLLLLLASPCSMSKKIDVEYLGGNQPFLHSGTLGWYRFFCSKNFLSTTRTQVKKSRIKWNKNVGLRPVCKATNEQCAHRAKRVLQARKYLRNVHLHHWLTTLRKKVRQ